MNANFIIDFWLWWIAGLIVCPLLVVLPQLKKIRQAIDLSEDDPNAGGKLFLTPFSVIISVVFGMGTIVSMILFIAAVVIGIVAGIRGIFV